MVAAVVLTVNTEVPVLFATEVGLNAQVGMRVATGVTLQVRLTVPVKLFTGATVTVEVALPPFATEAGARAVAANVKSGVVAAVTVTCSVLWLVDPAAPTVTV